MAIDRTGISSLDTGAPEITYSGNEGPKSPQEMQQMQQMQMAQLQEEYKKYVFEMEEQGLQPMSIQQFMEQALAEGQMSSREQGGTGNMAMKPGLIDEYRNYKMGQEEGGEQFMSPRNYYQSQEQDRAGVAYGGTANPTYTQSRKQRMAYGGIAGLDGRRQYGFGSFYQKYIKDPIEVAVTGKSFADLERESQARVDAEDEAYGEGYENPVDTWLKGPPENDPKDEPQTGEDPTGQGDYDIYGNKIPESGGSGSGGGGSGGGGEDSQDPWYKKLAQTVVPGGETGYFDLYGTGDQQYDNKGNPKINWKGPLAIGSAMGVLAGKMPKDVLPQDTSNINFQTAEQVMADPKQRFKPLREATQLSAHGGRIGYDNGGIASMREVLKAKGYDWLDATDDMTVKQIFDSEMGTWTDSSVYRPGAAEGGLMNLGGMEKDYRAEGGFVPIGGEEKADDVPARLSKNEFVFTADAVRSAGGGDIDRGAEIMENLMNNLEQGGQVSQGSQGLEGARDMFATSQRLGEVL